MQTQQTTDFKGFRRPNTTPVPDEIFDELLVDLSGAEMKVLLYICRRTFGFKKESDTISLKQVADGITTKDGRVLDRGTGLSKRHVQRALKSLEQKRVVEVSRQMGEDGVNEINTYSLHFVEGVGTLCPHGMDTHVSGVGTPVSTTINSIQETVNKTVTGGKSLFHSLPKLNQPYEKTRHIADELMAALNEPKSERMFLLIASCVPEQVIREALSEIKTYGANHPGKLFTHKMKQFALRHQDAKKLNALKEGKRKIG